MMKHLRLLSVLILSGFFSLWTHADTQVKSYLVGPATPVYQPVLIDSVNMMGEDYKANYLLNNRLVWNDALATPQNGETLTLSALSSKNRLQLVHFEALASHFKDTKLTIKSKVPMVLRLNNEIVETQLDPEKDLTYHLYMEPARRYDFTIQVLSTQEVPTLSCSFSNDSNDIQTAGHLKARYMLENTLFGNRVDGISISPSGRYILTRYSEKFEIKKTNTYTVITERKTGQVLLTDQGGRTLSWMPTSDKLLYTVKADHDLFALHTLDPKTSEDHVLTTGLSTEQYTMSPDETYLIFTTEEKARKKGDKMRYVASRMDRQPNSRTSYFLNKYDLKTGLIQRMTYGYHSANLTAIAPDSKHLLYLVWSHDKVERPFTNTYLVELDATTFKADTIAKDSYLNFATYSPNSQDILLMAGPEAFNRIGMNCGNHPIPNNYDMQAYIYHKGTKKIEPISRDFDPSIQKLYWRSYDNTIYAQGENGSRSDLYAYDVNKKTWRKFNKEQDMLYALSMAKTSQDAVYLSNSLQSSRSAYTYNLKTQKSTLYADPMGKTLQDISLGKVEDFNFRTADSTLIEGWVCLPPDYDKAKKYPMIVYYYGGTSPSTRYMEFYYSAELLASRGYIVYEVNPSGCTGYGQEFSARHVNAYGIRTADDIIEGVKRVCKKYPSINTAKIGCLGASYGGFMTEYLQTQTDIFACAVAHAGISNLSHYWGEGYWGVGYNTVACAGKYPWSDKEFFTTQGALWQADKINTPLLMLQGTEDTNVPTGESISLYNALKVLGKDVEFVEVVGQNHIIRDLEKRKLWHATFMAYFAKYLQDDPTWWEHLYPKVYADSFE